MDTTPNLFLVGAPKCGTTSMYEYLRQHPQIFFPPEWGRSKEPNHFCPELEITEAYAIKDRREYLDLFAEANGAIWRGDASTNYLISEAAPENIKRFCPDARILVMLRPPIDMMHSYHSELFRHGHEDIADFHEAVAASADRRNGLRIPKDTGVPQCLDYLAMSRFSPQLERYLRVFGHDAVKVVLLEDMVAAPAQTFRSILQFLGVDSAFQPEFRVHNETPRHGRLERTLASAYKHPAVKHLTQFFVPYTARRKFLSLVRRSERGTGQTRQIDDELCESCRPDVERLAALIGRDLRHWQPRQRH